MEAGAGRDQRETARSTPNLRARAPVEQRSGAIAIGSAASCASGAVVRERPVGHLEPRRGEVRCALTVSTGSPPTFGSLSGG